MTELYELDGDPCLYLIQDGKAFWVKPFCLVPLDGSLVDIIRRLGKRREVH